MTEISVTPDDLGRILYCIRREYYRALRSGEENQAKELDRLATELGAFYPIEARTMREDLAYRVEAWQCAMCETVFKTESEAISCATKDERELRLRA